MPGGADNELPVDAPVDVAEEVVVPREPSPLPVAAPPAREPSPLPAEAEWAAEEDLTLRPDPNVVYVPDSYSEGSSSSVATASTSTTTTTTTSDSAESVATTSTTTTTTAEVHAPPSGVDLPSDAVDTPTTSGASGSYKRKLSVSNS